MPTSTVLNPCIVKKRTLCMSIYFLLLDNEKQSLRDTGREKSKQLVEEDGEAVRLKERKQRRAVWMWLMRSLRGRLCHCNGLRREQKDGETRKGKGIGRKKECRRERKGRKWEGTAGWLTRLHLTRCYERNERMRRWRKKADRRLGWMEQ